MSSKPIDCQRSPEALRCRDLKLAPPRVQRLFKLGFRPLDLHEGKLSLTFLYKAPVLSRELLR